MRTSRLFTVIAVLGLLVFAGCGGGGGDGGGTPAPPDGGGDDAGGQEPDVAVGETTTSSTGSDGTTLCEIGGTERTVTVRHADGTPAEGVQVQMTRISTDDSALLVHDPEGSFVPAFAIFSTGGTASSSDRSPVEPQAIGITVVVAVAPVAWQFGSVLGRELAELTYPLLDDGADRVTVDEKGNVEVTDVQTEDTEPVSAHADITMAQIDEMKGARVATDIHTDDVDEVFSANGLHPEVVIMAPNGKWPCIVDVFEAKAPGTVVLVPKADKYILEEAGLEIQTPEGTQSGKVRVRYEITAPQSTGHSLNISWGHQGIGQAHDATIIETDGGSLTQPRPGYFQISDVGPGVHSFVWDSEADMPDEHRSTVQVAMSYVDPVGGGQPWAKKTEYFEVDNTDDPGQLTTVIDDDFDDNDISDWTVASASGRDAPEPAVSGGIVSGIGQGYSEPGLHAAISKAVSFDASNGLEVALRAMAGSSWPNSTRVHLVTSGFGTRQWSGYWFSVYGESFRRFDIVRVQNGEAEFLGQYPLGSAVHDWHDYRVTRDSAGNWTLYIDGSEQSSASFAADMTFAEFDHASLFFHRDQSKCDWLTIRADN